MLRMQHFGIGTKDVISDRFLIYGFVWEYHQPSVIPYAARAVLFWKTDPNLDTPNAQIVQSEGGRGQRRLSRSVVR
jgi:hypothetical protein